MTNLTQAKQIARRILAIPSTVAAPVPGAHGLARFVLELADPPAPAGLPAPRPRTIDSELGRLVFWGSECLCGNATYGSMRCDSCQESTGTTALWMEPRPAPAPLVTVADLVGSDPDIAGGRSAEDHVRHLRD